MNSYHWATSEPPYDKHIILQVGRRNTPKIWSAGWIDLIKFVFIKINFKQTWDVQINQLLIQ